MFTAAGLVTAAAIYLRGWMLLDPPDRDRGYIWRALAFLTGELLVFAVIASPLAHLDHQWLAAHMVQHLVLMTLAAPSVLLSEPVLTFLRGLPSSSFSTRLTSEQMRSPLHHIERLLLTPAVCWLAGTLCVMVWHIPAAFELGMRSAGWHEVEQGTFFVSGLCFWWPVIQPWPSVAARERWHIPLYLFLATIPCDALSAFFAFCGHVVYPIYASSHQTSFESALRDQERAGAMMWVWVTFIYLVPAVFIAIQLLSPARPQQGLSARIPEGK